MYADKVNFKGRADTVLRWYEIKPEYLLDKQANINPRTENEAEEQNTRGG